jgi:acrylyl-CoA reductase (NADPH)
MSFRAIVIDHEREGSRILNHTAEIRHLEDAELNASPGADLDGSVTIDVEFSGINYKDAMALAGRPGILRNVPLIPGIDLVGTVIESGVESAVESGVESGVEPSGGWQVGDRVVLNGDGLGERSNGGLAERARVRPNALVRIPDGISNERAAAIGTAGFTAMLAALALDEQGVSPADGEVVVTGAAGGVGSIAVALLAHRGYSVTASTGRIETEGAFLKALGASTLLDRAELAEPGKPLQSARWGGAIDVVGGATLANLLAQLHWGGAVAACGLAQGPDLPTTVLPFILRAAKLIGINSVEAPRELRRRAWEALASELDLELLDSLTTTIGLGEAFGRADELLAGKVRGRTVVDVRR